MTLQRRSTTPGMVQRQRESNARVEGEKQPKSQLRGQDLEDMPSRGRSPLQLRLPSKAPNPQELSTITKKAPSERTVAPGERLREAPMRR